MKTHTRRALTRLDWARCALVAALVAAVLVAVPLIAQALEDVVDDATDEVAVVLDEAATAADETDATDETATDETSTASADDGIATLELDEDDYAALEAADDEADDDDAAEASEDDLDTTAGPDDNGDSGPGGDNNNGDQNQNTSATLSVSIVDSSGNSISVNSNSSVTTSFTVDSTGVTFASSATSSFTSGTGTSETTYTYSYAQIYVNNSWVTITAIRWNGSSYEYTTDGNTWTSAGSSVSVRLVYTASSSSNSTDLDITKYLNSSLVLWDMNSSSQTDDDTGVYVSSVTLNGTSVTWAESSSVNTTDSTATGYWGAGSALSTYFPNTADGTYYDGNSDSTDDGGDGTATVTLTITPVAGYYVTSVVIACAPTSGGTSSTYLTPYNCSTWASENATTQSFSDTSGGSVTLDVSNLSFAHTSSSGYYFILITVAPIPSPVYVEYSYGEIVGYLADDGCDTSAFSTTSWTSASSNNVYTYASGTSDGGVQTANVQFKYTYNDSENSTEDASKWKHYANSVSADAIAAAWADGYVFVGWEVTYYYDMGITKSTSTGTYENDYLSTDSDGSFYSYGGDSGTDGAYNAVGDSVGYPFSSVYGKTFVQPGEEIVILNHTYIKAVWIKVDSGDGDLLVSKTVSGNAADPDYHFTFTLTSTDTTTTTTTEVENGTTTSTTTYDIDGTYAITFSGIDDCTYTGSSTSTATGATAHGSSVSSTTDDDGNKTYTITFTNGTATLYLADGESALIEDLPSGVTVTVAEDSSFAEDNAYASTTVETTTTSTTVSSDTTDGGSTDDGSTDDSTVTTLAVAADDDADGEDDGGSNEEGESEEESSATTSTYSAKVTIPAMTIPTSAITTTATPVYDDDGDVTDYTYAYTIDWTKCTKSQMNVAFTNTFTLSPDNGVLLSTAPAAALLAVGVTGGAAVLATVVAPRLAARRRRRAGSGE